jgi:hypothetical protein
MRIEARQRSEDTMALCDLGVTRDPNPPHRTRQYLQTMMNAQGAGHHGEVERFQLRRGEMYRISYTVRTPQQRRVTRSLAVYAGSSKRRLWDGREAVCYEFQRPHGRPLSLLRDQIVEARPATLNDRGQLVLVEDAGPRRPLPRNLATRGAWSPPPWSAG